MQAFGLRSVLLEDHAGSWGGREWSSEGRQGALMVTQRNSGAWTG